LPVLAAGHVVQEQHGCCAELTTQKYTMLLLLTYAYILVTGCVGLWQEGH